MKFGVRLRQMFAHHRHIPLTAVNLNSQYLRIHDSIMYDDASFYTFIPSAHLQEERPRVAKHKRKQSLLKQPNVSPVLHHSQDNV